MTLETKSLWKAHGGMQGVYTHAVGSLRLPDDLRGLVPPHAEGRKLPVLWYLSGLTCTHANVMEKGEYRKAAAEHGVIIVCPDTSPRGEGVADVADDWKLGCGAGFYVDATQDAMVGALQDVHLRDGGTPRPRRRQFPHGGSGRGRASSAIPWAAMARWSRRCRILAAIAAARPSLPSSTR